MEVFYAEESYKEVRYRNIIVAVESQMDSQEAFAPCTASHTDLGQMSVP